MKLVRYEQAREALATCARVDEAKDIRDKAEALRVYGRQAKDTELETWAAEIKLRANRRIGELSRDLEKGHGPGRGKKTLPSNGIVFKREALKEAGISTQDASRCEQLASIPDGEFEGLIVEKKAAGKPIHSTEILKHVARSTKEKKRENRRSDNKRKVEETALPTVAIGMARFATIAIDPPWDWGDEGDVDQLGRAKPTYATMSFDELLNLPVGDFADEDCHLYLWITNRSLPKGFALVESWGFRYITCLTWCKPSFGMGNYFRGQTEQILFGVKGSQPLKRKDAGTWFQAERGPGGHSSKPDDFYSLVESCSPGPYLEMFSRRNRPDWKAWGADAQ